MSSIQIRDNSSLKGGLILLSSKNKNIDESLTINPGILVGYTSKSSGVNDHFTKERKFTNPSTYWSNYLFNLLHLYFGVKKYLNYNESFLDSNIIHVKHKKLTSGHDITGVMYMTKFYRKKFPLIFLKSIFQLFNML